MAKTAGNSKPISQILHVVCAAACAFACAIAMAGCTSGQTMAPTSSSAQVDAVTANRQYMSAVNQIMDELGNRLQTFNDAVSQGDTVRMRTQADDAFKTLDELATIEAPDDLKQLQAGYTEAANGLKDALSEYIELYTDVSTEGSSFDFSSYTTRLEDIQKKYNDAIDKLKSTDETAVNLKQGDSDGESSAGSSNSSSASSSSSEGESSSSSSSSSQDSQ